MKDNQTRKAMNLPLSEHQAAALYDILNYYSILIDSELEETKDETSAHHLLESRSIETDDLIREFDAMIQRRTKSETRI